MKTTIKLLALLFLISCKTSDDSSRLRGFLVDDTNRETMLLDFSEDYAELRNNIAKKHQVDLCDTTLAFKSLIPLKNDDSVLVNLSVFDICFPYTPTWGTIEILVKSNDEIRVDMKYTTLDSVHHLVLGELRGIIQDQRLNGEVVFKLEWQDASQKTIKDVVAKSISALQQFILEETQETYGVNLHSLDEKDFLKLKKNFYFEIALTQVRPDVPVDIGELNTLP